MEFENIAKISGLYKHYKGKNYDVYCTAFDREGNKYVLYRQNYGDKSFWIRPYTMFFESVNYDGKDVKRFKAYSKTRGAAKKVKELISLIERQDVVIRNSETDELFIITNINESNEYVMVHRQGCSCGSGYLTEYELSKRLGYYSCRVNGEIKFFKIKEGVDEYRALKIGNNNIEDLKVYLNPCSIDLQIADSGFLRTRFKLVDPQSVEHVSSASELWKPVRKRASKSGGKGYFRIAPGATILTHTKERIRIPGDCAGKIEIKSTFARLSLSITFGDFCNPGYDGFFPLEIKNNGRHTIIIHENETMVQLMLIPLGGPILDEYSEKATFKNRDGYDDGTPYSFWRERSLKALREKYGTQQVVELFQKLLKEINTQNTSDVNAYKDRFNNNFLPFCHKNINKNRHRNNDSNLPDVRKLINAYIKREKLKKALFNIKWASGAFALLVAAVPAILERLWNAKKPEVPVEVSPLWPFLIGAAILFIVTVVLFILTPKLFCTFENIDVEKVLNEPDKD